MKPDAENRAFYDLDSASYDRSRWCSEGGAYTNRVQQQIIGELTAGWRGTQVLELGSGTGRFSIPIAAGGSRLTLCDLSAGMLGQARANLVGAGQRGALEGAVNASAYRLPFRSGRFDHVITINMLNHLQDMADALQEMARVVRPGGTVVFNYANLISWYGPAGWWVNRRGTAIGQEVYSRWIRPVEVLGAVSAAGLEVVRAVGHAHVPRAVEASPLVPMLAVLDRLSRRGVFRRFGPIQYYCCSRKR